VREGLRLLLLVMLLPLQRGLQAVRSMQCAVLHAGNEEGDEVDTAHAAVEEQAREVEGGAGRRGPAVAAAAARPADNHADYVDKPRE
jgi:hypothetical protein